MPIKEFECTSCGHKFDEILGIKDPDPSACPKCGKESLKQLLSTFRIAGVRSKSAASGGRAPEEGGLGAGPAGEFQDAMAGGGMDDGLGEDGMDEAYGSEDGFGGDEDAGGEDLGEDNPDKPEEE